jgi:hypothetical protein
VTGYRFAANNSATSADGFYAIASNGNISITAAGAGAGIAQNDFETAPNNFSYAVQARDAVGNWSSAANVTLSVTDLNDAPALPPSPPPPVKPPPVEPPAPPILDAGLSPGSDDGASNSDRITSVAKPVFTVEAGTSLSSGDVLVIVDKDGNLLGGTFVSDNGAATGSVEVPTFAELDDGHYTFTVLLFNSSGVRIGETPVQVTIATDLDGVLPSIELAANGGLQPRRRA